MDLENRLSQKLFQELMIIKVREIMGKICANLEENALNILESLITNLKKDYILVIIEHSNRLDYLADKTITFKEGSIYET